MIRSDSLFEIVCAKSIDDQHFIKDPITLNNCGHSICMECLPKPPIKCGKCGKVTDRDLRTDKASIIAKTMIKTKLEVLYKEMEKLTSESIDKVISIFKFYLYPSCLVIQALLIFKKRRLLKRKQLI
jgi:hypothetical protein